MGSEPVSIALPPPGPELDALLQGIPDTPAVFVLHAAAGRPYLSRTALLGRRVRRLLKSQERFRAALNLRGVVNRLDYWPTVTRLESSLTFYTLAKQHFPEDYLRLCKIKMPVFLRLFTANEFPRTQITTRIGGRGLSYGPFRTRASAESFEQAALDLFQLRRCQEDLDPDPGHPGCIYGEMGQCMRPCQEVVSSGEYATEVDRFVDFVETKGRSLSETVERMRDRHSADLEFEEAARQHKRLEKIQAVWKLPSELAETAVSGVAVLKCNQPAHVLLLFLVDGCWQEPVHFQVEPNAGNPVSLDRRLKEMVENMRPKPRTSGERQEHIAILARWFYSSWCDGAWLPFSSLGALSYRKLVNKIRDAVPSE